MKKQQGITLIALVITIIVLLILAGITIALITSNDSAPQKAVEAREANDKGAARDTAALLVADKVQGYYEAKYVNRTTDVATPGEYVNSALSSAVTQGDYKVVVLEGTLKVFEKNADITTADPLVYGVVASDGTINWGTTAGGGSGGGGDVTPGTALTIGDTVNYSTSLNGVDLTDWRVFYIDGDDTYLILDGFLPNSAVNVDNIHSAEYDDYCVDAGSSEEVSRGDFIRAMTTTTNWSELVTNGKINGESINQNVLNDMWAMGSPTLQLYVNSWNESYPNAHIYMDSIECEDGCDGYFISLTEEALEWGCDYIQPDSYDDEIEVDEETGAEVIVGGPRISYYNAVEDDESRKLYDPYYYDGRPSSLVYGYWLATGSWDENNSWADVYTAGYGYAGSAWASDNYYYNGEYALRPVIKLPTSVLNQ